MLFLVRRKIRYLDAVKFSGGAAKADQLFRRHSAGNERLLPLLAIEHVVELVGGDGLVPEDIARMVRLLKSTLPLVGVEDGPPKGDVFGAIAIAAQGHVPTGENKLELLRSGLTEDGDRLALAEAAYIVLQLLVIALVPVGMGHAEEDLAHESLLLAGVEAAVDRGLRDLPVVLEPGAQQAALRIDIIPVKADRLFLLLIH